MSLSTRTRSAAQKRRKLVDAHENSDAPLPAVPPTNPSETSVCITAKNLQRVLEKGKNPSEKCQITYLTPDQASWILLAPQWQPCPNEAVFDEEWNLHPSQRHLLKIFGRIVPEKRWSTSWGASYAYSGATNEGRAIPSGSRVAQLLTTINDVIQECLPNRRPYYNACLQNWYEPDDTIGRHADDERDMVRDLPIFSLSWGGTRRFVLRSKTNTTTVKTELYLHDGDLLVMGGTTQQTHYHEVPKRRVTMDPPTSRRINWTLRAFHKKALTEKKTTESPTS